MVPSAFSATAVGRSKMIGPLLSAAISLCIAGSASAQSGISQYPYCIQGIDNPGWSGCYFNTLQACQAAASGTEAECLANPWYKAGQNAEPPSQQMPRWRQQSTSRRSTAQLAEQANCPALSASRGRNIVDTIRPYL